MKKRFIVSIFVPIAVISLTGFGCDAFTAKTQQATVESGTLLEVLPEATRFVQSEYPEAVLIGANNTSERFYVDDYFIPTDAFINRDGSSSFWVFIYATSKNALDDEVVEESEAASVRFQDGVMTLSSPEGVVGADAYANVRTEDIKMDSDEAFQAVLTEARAQAGAEISYQHILVVLRQDQELIPDEGQVPEHWEYDITLFEDDQKGWSGYVDPSKENAEPANVRPVEFYER